MSAPAIDTTPCIVCGDPIGWEPHTTTPKWIDGMLVNQLLHRRCASGIKRLNPDAYPAARGYAPQAPEVTT